ncbi:TetR family transcriptional regulator [Paenibacillus sp. J31TS4]|uniref:TetR/AcrR family transcriptional regulator n=1 Tax=Paenibacillus sp. J31TS4 TaxID=2807195 RepID=UPI001B200D11|nr:TetR/AcrR family transcriptional regulator [Paenibacillus sp. J31TS4]GIP38991.1 TetR family transcriptional regulator [Paenibacillus sp. J31TS4]
MKATLNKKENILRASLELFAERGFDGTTVPMIADRAEVGAGTIYRYFENKEALVNVLFQDCVAGLSDSIRGGYPEEGTVRDQFRHVFYGMVRFASDNIQALHFLDTHSGARFLNADSRDRFDELMGFLHAYARSGQQQGVIRPLPAHALIGIVFGAFTKIFTLIRSGILEETPVLLAGIEESCWSAVRQPAE